MQSNTYLIVHTDHRLDIDGPNSGAENATLAEAKYLTKTGKQVFVCGIFGGGNRVKDGITFIDVGPSYDVESALQQVRALGPYHLFAVGKAIALVLVRSDPLCLSRTLITHDRGAADSGLRAEVLATLVDTVVCVSKAQQNVMIEGGLPADKSVVIHNGVDQSIFYPGDEKRRDYSRLVFAGALIPDKGIHVLIKSFVDLKPAFPNLKLDVYGTASLWGRKEFLDQEDLSRKIPGLCFHGKVSQAVIADALRNAGLCVVPSIWFDPFPFASIEAQVCGCPVLTFNVGGLPEGLQADVTGIVLNDISEQGLSKGLHALLSDSSRLQQMSAAATAYAPQRFRWEETVAALIRFAERAASAKRETLAAAPRLAVSDKPLVSIVIPCFNQAEFLPDAVRSVVGQEYENWECIIVNDGSPDNTSEIARRLITYYAPRGIQFVEKINGGLADARNAGVRASSGEYVLFLDADDMIHPLFLKETVSLLQANSKVGFVYTAVQHLGMRRDIWSGGAFNPQYFLRENQLTCSALFRRTIFDQVGGLKSEMQGGFEDWEFWISAYERGWLGMLLDKPYFLYRKHAEQSMLEQVYADRAKHRRLKAKIISLHESLYTADEVAWARQILANSATDEHQSNRTKVNQPAEEYQLKD